MTQTPNSPAELLLQQLQLEGQDEQTQHPLAEFSPEELVDLLTDQEADFTPTQLVEVSGRLLQKLLNFHSNCLGKVMEDNDQALPQDQLFWLVDALKLDQALTLVKQVLSD